jgi:hypothetical protein
MICVFSSDSYICYFVQLALTLEMKSTTGILLILAQETMCCSEKIAGTNKPQEKIRSYQAFFFPGNRIIIWNRSEVRRFLTHTLAGGGSHNLGNHALRREIIVHWHGNGVYDGMYFPKK